LLPVYPAREKPITGINSEIILEKIRNKEKCIISKNQLINHLRNLSFEVLITMGAGDIGLMTNEIEKLIIGK